MNRRTRARLRLIVREAKITGGILMIAGLMFGCWAVATVGPR